MEMWMVIEKDYQKREWMEWQMALPMVRLMVE